MAEGTQNRIGWAAWLFIGASVIALLLGFYDYFAAWGINHTLGALIVLCASGVLLAAALLVCLVDLAHGIAVTAHIVIAIDLLGILVATWFLEAYLMLAFTVLAAIGWIAWLVLRKSRARREYAA